MKKYTLNLDENNYVLSIAHTMDDSIELDLSEYDLTYLSAYKFVNGELVLDESKLAELKAKESNAEVQLEIAKLKQELDSTDYKIIKCSEYQLAGLESPYDITELHATRQALRDKINLLESK